MVDHANATAEVSPGHPSAENYGLHAGVLGPVETLAQSSLRHRSLHIARTHHSVGLRARRKRYLVRLSPRHGCDFSCWLLREPVCPSLGLARVALQLHGKHASTVFWRDRRLGIASRLPGDRRFGSRRGTLTMQTSSRTSTSTGRFPRSPRWCWCASCPRSSPIAT